MTRRLRIVALLAALAAPGAIARAADEPPPHRTLVELFTSQG